MKVAIVHYWLVGMRGGEKVLEALCEMFPKADIFTHVVDPSRLSDTLKQHQIKTTFISRLPRARSAYQKYLPLMPLALENLDLSDYNLVLSSEAGPAKGIIPHPDAVHICYCHSPMRYIWNMYHAYRKGAGRVTRMAMPLLSHYLRSWDESSASRVDTFVANSHNVASRIRKYYRRDAIVVYPPVDVEAFSPAPANEVGEHYLMVGELVRYKRPDLAVATFNRLGKRLVVIGDGEMAAELKRVAGPTIEFLGRQPFDVLRHYYARSKALIFPGEEDFGIVPVEMLASARPVIAYGRGGVLETVEDEVTGILFPEQSVDSLATAVERMDNVRFDQGTLTSWATRFNKDRFKAEMSTIIRDAFESERRRTGPTRRLPAEPRAVTAPEPEPLPAH